MILLPGENYGLTISNASEELGQRAAGVLINLYFLENTFLPHLVKVNMHVPYICQFYL